MTAEIDPATSAVFRRVAPAWWWVRENFKLPSVLTIVGMLGASAAWIWNQHADLGALKSQVAAIRDPGPRFDALEQRARAVELDQAAAQQQLADFNRRVAVQEAEWDRVHDAARQRVRSARR